jgi:hypothetical protein
MIFAAGWSVAKILLRGAAESLDLAQSRNIRGMPMFTFLRVWERIIDHMGRAGLIMRLPPDSKNTNVIL